MRGAFLAAASPAIRSRLSLFYLSQSAHAVSQAHMHSYIATHCLCRLDLLLTAASTRSSNMANFNRMEELHNFFFFFAIFIKMLKYCMIGLLY